MHSRFSSQKHPYLVKIKKFQFSLLLFVLFFIFFLFSIENVNSVTLSKQYDSLDQALRRNIAHCYAVEGTYPPSLNYLVDHYGLTYNEKLFYIDYRPISANLYPDYEIIILQGAE